MLLLYLFFIAFSRFAIGIESPTACRPRASTSTSASTSPASFSSTTVWHGKMDGALGDARLHRPPRRFYRTSTLAGSSSSSPIGTPSPTSSTVISPHATRSDQPTCVIQPAPVTSVLVERAPLPSMEGCHCAASSGSSGVTPWSSPPLLPHRRRPRPRLHRRLVAARFTQGLRQAV